jgi:hypothetical protein
VVAAGAVVAAAAPVVAAGFVAAAGVLVALPLPQAASSMGRIIVSSANEIARAHDFLPRFGTVAMVSSCISLVSSIPLWPLFGCWSSQCSV